MDSNEQLVPDAAALPSVEQELGFWLAPIDVRRAVLGVFFRANGGPLSVAQVVQLTAEQAGLDLARLGRSTKPTQRVSDILRHQVRFGRAEVVRRGVYRLLVGRFSDSTRDRCLHWRREALRRNQPPRWGDRVLPAPPAAPPPIP